MDEQTLKDRLTLLRADRRRRQNKEAAARKRERDQWRVKELEMACRHMFRIFTDPEEQRIAAKIMKDINIKTDYADPEASTEADDYNDETDHGQFEMSQ